MIGRNDDGTSLEVIPDCMVGTENTGNYVAFQFGRIGEAPSGKGVITGIFHKKLPKSKQMRAN